MGYVAAFVANLHNQASFDLAYTRQGTPEWEHFRSMFEGVRLDSPLAKAMRANERRPWQELDAFTALQNRRLQAAVDGDPAAFWHLVKDLWVDPESGRYEPVSSSDLSAFPGAGLWPEDLLRSQLRITAAHYLTAEHDHRATWLGTLTLDYRAHAGFFALTVLHDEGLLDQLPRNSWASWAGTILEHTYHYDRPGSSLRRDLFDRLTQHASEELAAAVTQLVRTHLAHGETPLQLADLPIGMVPVLAALAVETHTALRNHIVDDKAKPPNAQEPVTDGPVVVPATAAGRDAARATWAALLRQPLQVENHTALADARLGLSNHSHTDPDIGTRLAVTAGAALLAADANAHWPAVHNKINTAPDFATELARTCSTRYNRPAITEALPDHALGQAYRWLAIVCPPGTEVYHHGFRQITTEDNIHEWRNMVLSALSQRGTADAVRDIRTLADDHPEDLSIKAALVVARRVQANSTSPLRSQDVTALLTDTTRRVVHTAVQLAHVITDTLDQIAADLHSHANLLWDSERPPRTAKTRAGQRPERRWLPKREGALATYIAHELQLRLQRQPIVVNREVVITPTGTGDSGRRPDILVTSKPPISDRTTDTTELCVPIEIKGTWHKAVLTAQRAQLAKRYLSAAKTDVGVYLVGWYPLEHWDAPNDAGRTIAKKHPPLDALRHELTVQATAIHNELGSRTCPYVLEIPRSVSGDKPTH